MQAQVKSYTGQCQVLIQIQRIEFVIAIMTVLMALKTTTSTKAYHNITPVQSWRWASEGEGIGGPP